MPTCTDTLHIFLLQDVEEFVNSITCGRICSKNRNKWILNLQNVQYEYGNLNFGDFSNDFFLDCFSLQKQHTTVCWSMVDYVYEFDTRVLLKLLTQYGVVCIILFIFPFVFTVLVSIKHNSINLIRNWENMRFRQ